MARRKTRSEGNKEQFVGKKENERVFTFADFLDLFVRKYLVKYLEKHLKKLSIDTNNNERHRTRFNKEMKTATRSDPWIKAQVHHREHGFVEGHFRKARHLFFGSQSEIVEAQSQRAVSAVNQSLVLFQQFSV